MKRKWVKQRLIPAVFVLLLSFLVWTYIRIKEEENTGKSDSISLEIIPDYRIVTGADLKLWPKDTVLNQGMAAYFYVTNPIIHVNPVIQIKGVYQSRLEGSLNTSIILRSINDRSEIYWSYGIDEKEKEEFILYGDNKENNKAMSYNAKEITLDAVQASELANQINDELMFRGGIYQLVMITDIKVYGSINGKPVDYNVKQEIPITLLQDSFTIPKTFEMISEIPVNLDSNVYGTNRTLLYKIRTHIVLFTIDAILALLLIILLIASNISKTRIEIERHRFKEWITEGSVELQDRLPIKILKLQGLVDLAIDLDKRVIFDPSINKYFILDENLAYIYDPEHSHSILGNKTKLGKILLESRLLQSEQLELGLHYQKLTGMRLGESLVALGLIDEATLYSALAAQQKINYYEPDVNNEFVDVSWLETMSIIKARALMSLPLGKNSEGKLVIACAEPTSEGIKNALHELFGKDIIIVATKPTSVLKGLERIEKQQRRALINSFQEANAALLTTDEKNHFISSYVHGKLIDELLLKAAGLSETVNKEMTSLLKGLDKAVEAMEHADRQKGKLPDMLEVLIHANYLNSDTVMWITHESSLQGVSVKLLLKMNYLASVGTISIIEQLLSTLEIILQ